VAVVRVGDLVVDRGVATREQVDRALEAARVSRAPLCSELLATGVDEGRLAAVLAERHGVPGVDLSRSVLDLAHLDLVPRAVAEGDLMLPLSTEGGRIHLAMSEPFDEQTMAEVRFVTGREVSSYVAVHAALVKAIREAYDARERGESAWQGAGVDEGARGLAVVRGGEPAPEVEELVDLDDALPGDEPLRPVAEVEIEVSGEHGTAHQRADGKRLVLVVDDEPEIRLLVQKTFQARGFAVETAADGAEAVEKAVAVVPDLVLLDAMLPRLHGFEACRRLKADPRTRHVPVIMMTAIYRGWRFAQDVRESYGAEDYVEKPFRLEDLLRRADAAIDATAARRTGGVDGAEPALARGKELLAAGQLREALVELDAAAKADPYSGEAHYQLGRALRASGEHFRAMTALERATELRPHFAALRALAALYEEKGFRRKAAEMLERALPAAPDEASRETVRRELIRHLG
jgi:DNA-binding response OmpR family regulator